MEFELLRIAIAVIGTSIAAWQDARTSFIEEKLLYAMMAAGFILNLATLNAGFIFSSTAIALIILGTGYLVYKGGQLGGGDVLLFASIQLLLPLRPQILLEMPLLAVELIQKIPPVFSIVIASSFFAMIGSAFFYASKLMEKKVILSKEKMVLIIFFSLALIIFLSVFAKASLARIAFYALLAFPGFFLLSFRKQIMDKIIVKRIGLKEIEDEDILALEKMNAIIVKKYGLQRVLTRREVEKLKKVVKKEGLKKFPVCKVLPRFGPFILLALIVCLVAGDFFVWVLLQ